MTKYFHVNHFGLLYDMCLENLSHITVDFGNGAVDMDALDQADDDIVINYLLMTIPRKILALLGIYFFLF